LLEHVSSCQVSIDNGSTDSMHVLIVQYGLRVEIKESQKKNATNKMPGLLAATASGSSKQAWQIPDAVCTVLELMMMGRETARNMQRIDNNKEYCITLHLVGCT